MNISDVLHLKKFESVRFTTELVCGKSFTILSYMIADPEVWKVPFGLECCGHVFDESGQCVSLPFEKFFNYCENDFTHPSAIGNIPIKHVFEKRDGSLITPVLVNDDIFWKTKKTFYSDISKQVNSSFAFAKEKALCKFLLRRNMTPSWEYTDPNFPIVIGYGSIPKLTLLTIRDNITNEYLSWESVCSYAKAFDVTLIKKIDARYKSLSDIENEIKVFTDIEGYVIELENGMRVKLKTPWYIQFHHAMTRLYERDFAVMTLHETLDDLKIYITKMGLSLTPVYEIESKVVSELKEIINNTKELFDKFKNEQSRKDIAIKYGKDMYFSLAIKLYENKEPNYKGFWKTHFYKNYTLKCVYNINFSK